MEKAASNTLSNLRYERKFFYPNILPQDLIAKEVLSHSFCFREIFERRTVNNCYFDDASMSFYHQNVAGDNNREKYRLRWYGDEFSKLQNPVIEIKKKYGTVGDKRSFKLNALAFDLRTQAVSELLTSIKSHIQSQHPKILSYKLGTLSPTLFNSYERRYFLSHCEKYRITIDYNMKFFNPLVTQFQFSQKTAQGVVLELKYATEYDKEVRMLSQELSARLSKHSKYVKGIDSICYRQHN